MDTTAKFYLWTWRLLAEVFMTDLPLQITHLFSHIHQRYVIFGVTAPDSEQLRLTCSQPTRWVTKEEFLQSAASTAMKKVQILVILSRQQMYFAQNRDLHFLFLGHAHFSAPRIFLPLQVFRSYDVSAKTGSKKTSPKVRVDLFVPFRAAVKH